MNRIWLAIVFVVAVVAAGLPIWLMRYSDIEFPTSWLLPGLLVIVPLAAGTRFLGIGGIWAAVGRLTGAMLAANMLRVAWDTAADPTSHNLWPLELVMTALAGPVFSLPGALLGLIALTVAQKLRRA